MKGEKKLLIPFFFTFCFSFHFIFFLLFYSLLILLFFPFCKKKKKLLCKLEAEKQKDESHRHTDRQTRRRQTDRQTDRQTVWQRGNYIEKLFLLLFLCCLMDIGLAIVNDDGNWKSCCSCCCDTFLDFCLLKAVEEEVAAVAATVTVTVLNHKQC